MQGFSMLAGEWGEWEQLRPKMVKKRPDRAEATPRQQCLQASILNPWFTKEMASKHPTGGAHLLRLREAPHSTSWQCHTPEQMPTGGDQPRHSQTLHKELCLHPTPSHPLRSLTFTLLGPSGHAHPCNYGHGCLSLVGGPKTIVQH